MVEKIERNKPLTLLLLTGAVFFFLKYISPLISPILIAMLFVMIFGPTLKGMQKRLHIHRQLAAVILLVLAVVLLVGLLWILSSWIIGSLPEWLLSLDALEEELWKAVHSLCDVIERIFGIDSIYLESTVFYHIQEGLDYIQVQVLPEILSQSFTYLKFFAAFGAFLTTFLIAAVLLARDYDSIMNRLLDKEECHVLLEVICGVIRYIATYVKSQLIIMAIIVGTAAVVLWIAGIEQGVLWGLLAGFLDAIPFIGTSIVLIPLAISQLLSGSYARAVVCIILYVVCIFIRELLEPRLIGKQTGISPVAVLISIYAGVRLFGLWGIIKGPLGLILIYQTFVSIQRRRTTRLTKEEGESMI